MGDNESQNLDTVDIRKRLGTLEDEVARLRELKGLPDQLSELAKTVKEGLDSLSTKFDKMNDPEVIRKDERYRNKVAQLEKDLSRLEKETERIDRETEANTERTNKHKTIGTVIITAIGLVFAAIQALQFFKS